LFEALQFSYPEVVQELIAGVGGVARLTVIRVGERMRVTDVRVQHIAQRGRRFALVLIEDKTESFGIKAALDAADHASLVLDPLGRALAFNKPAQVLFAGVELGADASHVLSQAGVSSNWWQGSLTGRLKMQMEVKQRLYQVTSSSIALPGEEEQIYVIAFRPMPRGTAADTASFTATRVSLS
jgi:hypothetical protein